VIWGTWREPNFKFSATDAQGEVHEHFCYALSEADLRARLEKKGLTVRSIDPYDFSEWRKRARKATYRAIWARVKDRWDYFQPQLKARWPWLGDGVLNSIGGDRRRVAKAILEHDGGTLADAEAAIDAWLLTVREQPSAPGQQVQKTAIAFTDGIWREMKWHLFDLFHGKCAYCEHKPQAGYVGDVEHYRPKGKVDEDPDHPGYYWLAYDETNLLPSCAFCNQHHAAKLTHFPVAGAHARDPQSLPGEQPLLLNPYNRLVNPFDLLEFNETGITASRQLSQLGESSRKIYYLDRPGLSEARLAAMQLVEQDWKLRISLEVSIARAYGRVRTKIQAGDEEYTAARLWALERLRNRTIRELEDEGDALAQSGPNP